MEAVDRGLEASQGLWDEPWGVGRGLSLGRVGQTERLRGGDCPAGLGPTAAPDRRSSRQKECVAIAEPRVVPLQGETPGHRAQRSTPARAGTRVGSAGSVEALHTQSGQLSKGPLFSTKQRAYYSSGFHGQQRSPTVPLMDGHLLLVSISAHRSARSRQSQTDTAQSKHGHVCLCHCLWMELGASLLLWLDDYEDNVHTSQRNWKVKMCLCMCVHV